MKNPFKVAFVLIFFFGTVSAHAEVEINLSPAIPSQGQSLTFSLEDDQATSVTIYYRVTGANQYQQRFTSFQNNTAQITLDTTEVVAPGLQYYFQITRNGNTVFSPTLYPEYSPHMIAVELQNQPNLVLISPDINSSVKGDRLKIIISGAQGQELPEDVTISLDATDITPLVKRVNGTFEFDTDLMPDPGSHTIHVSAKTAGQQPLNQQWNFQVNSPRKQGSRQIYGRGNVSFNYGIKLKENSGSSFSDTLSANASMSFGARGDDWEATWDGINLRYIKDAKPDEITLGAGFHFTFTKGQQFFEYGDISINETRLTVSSLSRRGLQAKLKLGLDDIHVFYVGANTVKDWDSGLSESDNFIRGISWQHQWLSLPVTLIYSDGKQSGNGYNTSSNTPASEGQILGFAINPVFNNINFDLEMAFSNYDDDMSDSREKQNDISALIGLSTTIANIAINGDYHYYGTDFGSVANPNATTDRSGFSLSGSTRVGPSSISLNSSYDRDNVENDSTRPVVTSASGGINWGLSLANWPAINLSYNHSQQRSSKEPVGTDKVDNFNDTVNAGISAGGQWWSASLSGNYSKLNDQVGNLDSETKGVSLTGNLTPIAGYSLSPAINYVTTSGGNGITTNSEVASLTASAPLWEEFITSNLQGSVSHQDKSDNSSDAITYNGSVRLAFNISTLTEQYFKYAGSQTIALTFNYNHVEDKITPGNDQEDWSIFLNFNLLSFSKPIDWSVDF